VEGFEPARQLAHNLAGESTRGSRWAPLGMWRVYARGVIAAFIEAHSNLPIPVRSHHDLS